MQTDVDFNQTEAHMNEAANQPAELRPGLWQDPAEQQGAADHASPFSTGGDAVEAVQGEAAAQPPASVDQGEATNGRATATNGAVDAEPVQLSNEASHDANANLGVPSAPDAATSGTPMSSSDPSVPTAAPDPTSEVPTSDAQPEQAQPMSASAYNGNVDVQALLDTLQVPQSGTASGTDGMTSASPSSQAQPSAPGLDGSPSSAAGLGAPPSGLPPRPPPQEQPLIHPNYVHSQHIRDYHPHAAHPAFQPQGHARTGSQGNTAEPTSRTFVPPVHSPSNAASATTPQQQSFYSPTAATGPQAVQPSLSTPLSAQSAYSTTSAQPYQAPQQGLGTSSRTTPIESRRETKLAAGEIPSPEDRPWNADVQAKYDRFIESERQYVSEGRWEQFPPGSRLFVGTRNLDGTKNRKDEVSLVDDTYEADGLLGNLSSEKVTKRDIFHVFHAYGELAQISIKQAYGFVQFLSSDECRRALDGEQGRQIREKRIRMFSLFLYI